MLESLQRTMENLVSINARGTVTAEDDENLLIQAKLFLRLRKRGICARV